MLHSIRNINQTRFYGISAWMRAGNVFLLQPYTKTDSKENNASVIVLTWLVALSVKGIRKVNQTNIS